MKVLVINLPRSHQRRQGMIEQLSRLELDWKLVEGVDGLSLTKCELASSCDPISFAQKGHYLTPGAIGCALSHQKALQLVLSEGAEMACILEDDLVLPENFPDILREVETQITNSEVILLYWLSFEKQHFIRQSAVQLKTTHFLVESCNSHKLLSGVGYILTRQSAERMIKANQPIRVTADSWGYFLSSGALERIRCLVPSPIRLSLLPSDIAIRSEGFLMRWKSPLQSLFPCLGHWVKRRRERFYKQYSRFDWI